MKASELNSKKFQKFTPEGSQEKNLNPVTPQLLGVDMEGEIDAIVGTQNPPNFKSGIQFSCPFPISSN